MTALSSRVRFSVLVVLVSLTSFGLLSISCSDKESPTSPGNVSSAPAGMAIVSGTLTDASSQGQAGDPLPGVTVGVAGTRQTTQTDQAGRFTLSGLPPGVVALEFRGAGFQSGITVNALAGQTTRISVALNRGRSTVRLLPRSDGAEGTVDSIGAASFVLKNALGFFTIQTDGNTVFRTGDSPATFGSLKIGLRVEVEGVSQAAGSILAKQVNIEPPQEPERTKTPSPTGTITAGTPTSTRTPEVEETRTRTRTPEVEETRTQTRTPEPEETREPTRTPTPTGTRTVGTSTPTRTPEVEETRTRTRTPEPEETKEPTRTPSPTRTP